MELHRSGAPRDRLRATSFLGFALAVSVTFIACSAKSSESKKKEVAMLRVSSTAFAEGDTIPVEYTCDGQDVSPPLSWSGVPTGTKSIAITCTDPDAPGGMWVHWVAFNLPPDTTSIGKGASKSGMPAGTVQGTTDFRRTGYGGPCPPHGNPHRYYFTVMALDTTLNLSSSTVNNELLRAVQGHVLAKGQLMGRYKRR